jgi:hypothetical protein
MSTDTLVPDERAKWEEALLQSWKAPAERSDAPWQRLLTSEGLREFELLGVSRQQLPIVVELKTPCATEGPLQMLVRATAAGLLMRQAWPKRFRGEWAEVVTHDAAGLPEKLPVCELVCAAPAEYWRRWIGTSPLAQTMGSPAWSMIADLRRALQRNGFPSVFVRLEHLGIDWKGRPTEIRVVEQQLPR